MCEVYAVKSVSDFEFWLRPSPCTNQSPKSPEISCPNPPDSGAGRFKFENSWMFDIAYFAILDLDLGSIEGSQRDNK